MTTREMLAADPVLSRKAAFFENFWTGQGPYPILFAKPHLAKGRPWVKHSIARQHADPEACLEEALAIADYTMMDIDDGIPVARADLGTTLFPSFLGLAIHVEEDAHPWPAEHWSLTDYAGGDEPGANKTSGKNTAIGNDGSSIRQLVGQELRIAKGFYRLLMDRIESGQAAPLPYVPDNQGIFDLTHIIAGTELFYALTDNGELVKAAQDRSLDLYLAGTKLFKFLIGEENGSMLHGHGMPSGVWSPDIGARISEDSCTLISPDAIRKFCIPWLEQAAKAFGGLFLHFCGRHDEFLHLAAGQAWARVINLGNPEFYDLDELFGLCGKTGTVYFGNLDPASDEDDTTYLERMADLAGRHKAGLILVAPPPGSGEEVLSTEQIDHCGHLRQRWHDLTASRHFKRN
jgi:hypothetical protein